MRTRIRKRRALVVLAPLMILGLAGSIWMENDSSAAPPANAGATPSNHPMSSSDGLAFFEAKIRPVLVKQCYGCHSTGLEEVKGGLFLDTKQGMRRGGDNGPAILPGNVDGSLLIQAIRYNNTDLQMPPSKKLSDSVINDFEAWVKMGAPDTRDGSAPKAAKTYDTEAAKKWWAFQPMKRPAVAKVGDTDWPRGEIDRYVLASLEAKNIKPAADADKTTLIRRVTFDAIGLPPTPEEVDAFVKESDPDAYAKVVDRLLASPQFGERWGRHWLDVARYAESTGKDVNMTYPDAWRYRDYVIAAFNNDKPYDQFIREQLAGDLLPAATPKKRAEQQIATGFLAVGPKSMGEQASRQFELDLADEQVMTTTQAFMALTVACARCHDHKFDPIMQRDYYGMAGIFLSSKTKFGTLAGPRNLNESDMIELLKAADEPGIRENLSPEEREKIKKQLAAATANYDQLIADRARGAQKEKGLGQEIQVALGEQTHLESELNSYDAGGHPKAFCMGVEDRQPTKGRVAPMGAPVSRKGPLNRPPSGFETIADCPLFFRGEMSEPRDRVPRGIPMFLSWSGVSAIPPNESGRRELANWIASPRNPLTARVMANRLWHWLEGEGIVASVDNFGTMGESPVNPELLDYLAFRLIDNKWSVKKTVREILLSRTYQLSSEYSEDAFTADPQNALSWRHSVLRLDAECMRDAMLMSSGQLDLKAPVGSTVAAAGDGAISAGPQYMRINELQFINAAGVNRSVYLPAVRDLEPDVMGLFDYPDSNAVNGERESTDVPSQALYLLNNDYVRTQARRMAVRVMTDFAGGFNQPGVREERVNYAFQLALARSPTSEEQSAAQAFFAKADPQSRPAVIEAWTQFCLAIYNTAEFRFVK